MQEQQKLELQLAQDLKSLVRLGAKPSQCQTRGHLVNLVLSFQPDLPEDAWGDETRKFIYNTASRMPNAEAYMWLLFRADSLACWKRRQKVIRLLGLKMSISNWRHKPETEFMKELAREMLKGYVEPERKPAFTCPCGRKYYLG